MFCRTSAHFETLLVLNPQNGYFHTDMPLAWHSGRKERYVLFNDALDTFYLLLYLVKYHSDSKRGNLLPPHRLLFPFSGKGYFYMHHSTDRIARTAAFVIPVVEHWLERKWLNESTMRNRYDDPSHLSGRSTTEKQIKQNFTP